MPKSGSDVMLLVTVAVLCSTVPSGTFVPTATTMVAVAVPPLGMVPNRIVTVLLPLIMPMP